jgi:uncharacterized surface protein with fasciclin (FAS1) repeats
MKNFAKLIKLSLIVVTSTIMFSCSDDDGTTNENNSIAAIASRTPDLSILVDALERTDLVETLDQSGPYTVFAPTNAAFTAFLSANGFANLDAVPTAALKEILLNHVVNGTNLSTGLSTGYIKTLAKGSASSTNTLSMFVNTASGVRLNGVSSVSTADVVASNGVVHIVNAVIGLPTVVTHATANPNFSSLVGALTSAGQPDFVGILSGSAGSPFTVFAPSNTAFTAFETENPGTLASLTSAQLTAVLSYHVVAGANVLSNAIPTGPITTYETGTFTVSGTVITDEAMRQTNIVAVDVQASNGVIHVLDNIILPNLN